MSKAQSAEVCLLEEEVKKMGSGIRDIGGSGLTLPFTSSATLGKVTYQLSGLLLGKAVLSQESVIDGKIPGDRSKGYKFL